MFWSKHWNVVESNEWANLTYESGNGGAIGNQSGKNNKGIKKSTTINMIGSRKIHNPRGPYGPQKNPSLTRNDPRPWARKSKRDSSKMGKYIRTPELRLQKSLQAKKQHKDGKFRQVLSPLNVFEVRSIDRRFQ